MNILMSHRETRAERIEQKARVLLIGFDIWTGAVHRAMRHVSFDDLIFDTSALPGHHYNAIYPRLPALLSELAPDIVLLDLASTACRDWIDLDNLTAHLHGLLKLIGDFGAKVAFLHCYDVDPLQDAVLDTLNAQAAQYGLPVLDMSRWWAEAKGGAMPVDGAQYPLTDAVSVAMKIADFVRKSVMTAPIAEGLSDLPVPDRLRSLTSVDADKPLSPSLAQASVEPASLAANIVPVDVAPPLASETIMRAEAHPVVKQRVLLLGFSVLTGEMYRAFQVHAADDVEFVLFALGAHHYNYLPPLLPRILEREKPDIVVFDLASTPCREWTSSDSIRENVFEMLAMVHACGARAGFVHLFRHDVNPSSDVVIDTLNQLAGEFSLPVFNVARWISDHGGDVDHKLLFDGVHATAHGADVISAMIIDFVRNEMVPIEAQKSLANVPRSAYLARVSAVDAPALSPYGCAGEEFSRYGVHMRLLPVHEGARIPIDLPEATHISAIYFIHGPRSGDIEISTDHEVIMTHRCYDSWSYYERPMVLHVKVAGARRLWFRQLPGVPDVKLVKGEQDHSSRIGKIGSVIMFR